MNYDLTDQNKNQKAIYKTEGETVMSESSAGTMRLNLSDANRGCSINAGYSTNPKYSIGGFMPNLNEQMLGINTVATFSPTESINPFFDPMGVLHGATKTIAGLSTQFSMNASSYSLGLQTIPACAIVEAQNPFMDSMTVFQDSARAR